MDKPENDFARRLEDFREQNVVAVWRSLELAKETLGRFVRSDPALTIGQHSDISCVMEHINRALGHKE